MNDIIMFRQTIFVILTRNTSIYALHTYSSSGARLPTLQFITSHSHSAWTVESL